MSAGGVGHRFGARRERRAGRRRAWFSSAGVLAVGVALAVSACASSSSSGGSASGGGGSSASGSALKIMAFGQFQASTFSYPEGRDAILAAVKYYNAHGGFSGHQVQVTVCNDQGNPNLARQCAQQAVSDHDVAVLGSYSQQ